VKLKYGSENGTYILYNSVQISITYQTAIQEVKV